MTSNQAGTKPRSLSVHKHVPDVDVVLLKRSYFRTVFCYIYILPLRFCRIHYEVRRESVREVRVRESVKNNPF